VVIGPFNAILFFLMEDIAFFREEVLFPVTLIVSHLILIPVASMHFLAESTTSGPMPSPGIKAILCIFNDEICRIFN